MRQFGRARHYSANVSSQHRQPLWDVLIAWAAGSRSLYVLVPLLQIVGAFLITVGQELDDTKDWAWAGAGLLVLLLAVTLQFMRDRGSAVSVEATRLGVAMTTLPGVAELIADMPDMKTKEERQSHLQQVADQAVSALTLLLRDAEQSRAVVYKLDDSRESMSSIAKHGRTTRPKPKPFLSGTPYGNRALRMVKEGLPPEFEKDLGTRPDDGRDYQTYIAAPIHTGNYGYGMVTVDAPRPGDLTEHTDLHIVAFMADLLAIAFAEAHPADLSKAEDDEE